MLVCTYTTFHFGSDALGKEQGIDPFDNIFIATDEFHHVSAADNNHLGEILHRLIAREQAHVIAMTGSYFRSVTVPVLSPENEDKFTAVTYSYYEQLDG